MKQKVLFVCIHNSARSQLAEALLNRLCGTSFDAESAGLEPGTLNPLAVAVLQERGIDIRGKQPRGVAQLIQAGLTYDYVITVCDEASAERCPVFPGKSKRLHWGFADPSRFEGTWEERLARTRGVAAEIEARIRSFCAETCAAGCGA